tara:strand:+ start:71 stop:367 length:297 start_codon:yes stop_codon:yes gene_type:complete
MLKKNFTRKEMSNKIYQTLGFSKNVSSKIVDEFFEALIVELIDSNKVKISSFGTFEVIKKNERLGRNPKTKVESKISSRRVIRFKPSLYFKKKLNTNG